MKHTNKSPKTSAFLHLQNIINDSGSRFYLETKIFARLKRYPGNLDVSSKNSVLLGKLNNLKMAKHCPNAESQAVRI